MALDLVFSSFYCFSPLLYSVLCSFKQFTILHTVEAAVAVNTVEQAQIKGKRVNCLGNKNCSRVAANQNNFSGEKNST